MNKIKVNIGSSQVLSLGFVHNYLQRVTVFTDLL